METLQRVLDFLESLFPASLALPDDRFGLQVRACRNVKRVAVDLELTPNLVAWATVEKIDLLYLHHPPIWTPLHSLSQEDPYFVMLYTLYHHGISVFAHHTNLDSAPHGLAEQWIKILALEGQWKTILPRTAQKFKVVTFLPSTHLEEVSQAIFSTGAGTIGNYKGCSFSVPGTGTFIPQEGARPFLGTVGKPEQVSEIRLEVEVRAGLLQTTVEKILATHPYEEPVVDVYPLFETPGSRTGLGRIVQLLQPLEKEHLQHRVEKAFAETANLYSGNSSSSYQVIALCPGSGKSLLERVIKEQVDIFITGELSHHEIQQLLLAGIDYLPISHGKGERRAMQEICIFLREKAQEEGLNVEFLEGKP